ncbi:hypothetical protein SERLA73DRAFT_146265 [Serpula lacrymans var. lacrymans S7.3]|uniref:Uncharacterized protein n=1 Tax=Serpula lacrymans var. lacrymans (strain S7.3) TaxID=936435 RepID=F8QFB8_SERL3|nr:hypothetical protein SERLA73DRAFT_146265 [Serpula lacrymans var. lacrymans S7.3]
MTWLATIIAKALLGGTVLGYMTQISALEATFPGKLKCHLSKILLLCSLLPSSS